MDLFGDLPDPSGAKLSSASAPSNVTSLYDDVPSQEKGSLTTTNTENVSQKRSLEVDNITGDEKASKLKPSVKYKLCGYHAERQGEREDMQDACVIIENFTDRVPNLHPSIHRLALFAVYDGHGGARASQHAAEHLHKHLINKFPKGKVSHPGDPKVSLKIVKYHLADTIPGYTLSDILQVQKEMKKILVETFKKTDEEFLKEALKSKPVWKDGTTATVILVINDTAVIASLGDSQAFLCRRQEEEGGDTYMPIHLTSVHNPSVYEERIRIQKAGGQVKDGRVVGVLEVSRSIGDGQFKKHGVICTPDVKKCQLTDDDSYIVLACDGLWKTFSPEECIKFTNKCLQEESSSNNESPEESPYQRTCGKLASEAVLRLSADNVTVVLISINKIS